MRVVELWPGRVVNLLLRAQCRNFLGFSLVPLCRVFHPSILSSFDGYHVTMAPANSQPSDDVPQQNATIIGFSAGAKAGSPVWTPGWSKPLVYHNVTRYVDDATPARWGCRRYARVSYRKFATRVTSENRETKREIAL